MINQVVLVGRLVKDPEIRYTRGDNAKAMLRYTLAVNRPFRNSEGVYEADFISCVAWDKNAEYIANNFHKGSMMGVIGNIRTGNYMKDGQRVYTTDVWTDRITFVGGKSEGEQKTAVQKEAPRQRQTKKPSSSQNASYAATSSNNSFMNIPDTDDDIMPF